MAVTLDSLRKAIKKNTSSRAFAWLADMERAAGDLDKALQRVDGGLTLYPGDVTARLVRAKILFQQEAFEPCIQECEKILVIDSFNLAAQRMVGDAYDKLGNEEERNRYYRRVHDMDPLNSFWKEEYDVVAEAAVAEAAVEAAAGAPSAEVSEGEFSMPEGDAFNMNQMDSGAASQDDAPIGESLFAGAFTEEDDSVAEAPAPAAEPAFEAPADAPVFEKSYEDPVAEPAVAEPAEEESLSFGGSLFSSSAFSEPEEPSAPSIDDRPAPAPAPEAAAEPDDDDPFAALAAMLPNGDAADDSAVEDLSASLDSVMNSFNTDLSAGNASDEFPADDNISGNDVTSALSGMFGLDDDLEPADKSAVRTESMGSKLPLSIDEAAEENAANVFETVADDKPQSVDSAFTSIFGEDELPEEMPLSAARKSEPEPPVDDEGGLFEKAPVEKAPVAEEPPKAKPKPASADDEPTTIDNAFSSIFGDDELPEEKSFLGSSIDDAPASVETSQNHELNLSDDDDEGLFEKSSLFEKSPETDSLIDSASLDAPIDNVQDEAPAAVQEAPEALDIPTISAAPAAPAADAPTSVDNAFDSIFGADDDFLEDTPAESAPQESAPAAPAAPVEEPAPVEAAPAENIFEGSSLGEDFGNITFDKSSEDDIPVLKAPEENTPEIKFGAADDTVFDQLDLTAAAPEPQSASVDDTPIVSLVPEGASSVDNAFDSLFGDDDSDDVPEEAPAKPAVVDEVTETVPEETVSLAEQIDQADVELEMPEVKSDSSDIAKEMGGAFATMFGGDDDELDLSSAKIDIAPEPDNQEVTGAPVEERVEPTENSAPNNLTNALDDSFDNLFGKEDDSDLADDATFEKPVVQAPPKVEPVQAAPVAEQSLDSLESEVSGAFKGLFDMEDDSFGDESKPSNKGVDFLMSGDSDDEISAGLINNPEAPLDRGAHDLDESLNTRTLAEIYFDQGLYGKALEIYKDLVQKEPENEEIATRMSEVEKLYNEKFGGDA